MKKIIVLLFWFLVSCEEEKFVYYSYEKVTITRLNKGNEIHLYYGEYKKTDKLPDPHIKVNSFDGFVRGFLIFKESGEVEVINAVGEFEEVNNDRNKFKLVVTDYDDWYKKIKGKYKNIVLFEDLQKIEMEENIKNNSEVEIIW